jgi:hypothetical protein
MEQQVAEQLTSLSGHKARKHESVACEGFIAGLADATHDIDIGLVVSNAGTPNPLKLDRQLLQATLRLNTMAHLDITHHFRRETRRATPGRPYPHRVARRGNWGSVLGE